MPIRLQSSAFQSGGDIPVQYTCEGLNVSPPLQWDGIPDGTESLVLISDSPNGANRDFAHWVIFNVPPSVMQLPEDVKPIANLPQGGIHGANTYGNPRYEGPCPQGGPGDRFFFRVFALDTTLNLPPGSSYEQVQAAMANHILDRGELMGRSAAHPNR
jgi:Raf kinase inhibitor-like YbhB/YbcL family protein